MIVDLQDGEVISAPAGAYRCSMAHYHSQDICPGPSISSSGIRKIVNESPWHFWAQSELNPDRYPPKDPSSALILGRAAHSLLLGDEVFDEHFIYVPDDAPQRPTATQVAAFERDGKWSDAAAPRAKFWDDFDARSAGRSLLSQGDIEKIGHMAENLRRNPLAVEMLTGELTEISMIWQDDITGVWIKSRPDVIPANGADGADLKTFAPKSRNLKVAVQRSITDFGYDIQMALAQEGLMRVMNVAAREFVLVFIETVEPYTVIPVRLDAESLYWARVRIRHGIDTFKRCLDANDWPGPVDGILDYTIPPSIANRLAEQQSDGLMPNIERTW